MPAFTISAYSVEEIFVEKLRSLFQRAWARDYYDIYRLLEQESFDDAAIVSAFRERADAHYVVLDLAQGVTANDVDAVRAYWEQALDRPVTEQLSFDVVVERIDAYLRHLADVAE